RPARRGRRSSTPTVTRARCRTATTRGPPSRRPAGRWRSTRRWRCWRPTAATTVTSTCAAAPRWRGSRTAWRPAAPRPSAATGAAYRPSLSADGSTLVFETLRAWSRKDDNKTWDVYALRLDSGAPAPVLVSATPRGGAARGRSLAGVASGDGRYVAFMSAAAD